MLPRVFEFTFRINIRIAGYPIFLCHEITHEEVQKADKEENADIERCSTNLEDCRAFGGEYIRVYVQGGKMAKIVHTGLYEE